MKMHKPEESYDVVIVGGGPAGTSAAIHLASAGARILLVEQKRFPRPKLCGEFISPECLAHFARLGVIESMAGAGGAELLETVFYSRGGRGLCVPSEWLGGAGARALGLSRAEMDARLMERARSAGALVLEGTRACGLLTEGRRVRGVHLKRGSQSLEVGSQVVIDATGRARALARRAGKEGAGRSRRGAPLVAFKAHLDGAAGAPGRCEIYFYPGGYGGLSHVEGGLSNLCFIVSARDVRSRGNDAERVMREVVWKNRRAADTLARASARSEWLAVALEGFGRARVVPAEGVLAVGDAASFIDPFTGSGMLMALESGELAARTVARHLKALRGGGPFEPLAEEYRKGYDSVFGRRLRLCSLMRRAAFVPRLAETLIFALSASRTARKRLAQSTRRKEAIGE